MNAASLPHAKMMRAIQTIGARVAPPGRLKRSVKPARIGRLIADSAMFLGTKDLTLRLRN